MSDTFDYLCKEMRSVRSGNAVPGSDRSWVRQERGRCRNAEAWQDLCHRLIVKHNSNIVIHVKAVKGDV